MRLGATMSSTGRSLPGLLEAEAWKEIMLKSYYSITKKDSKVDSIGRRIGSSMTPQRRSKRRRGGF